MKLLHSLGCETLIALWKTRGTTTLGDIGFLRPDGAFYSIFNVFLDYDGNRQERYSPPPNFKPLWEGVSWPLQLGKEFTVNKRVIRRTERIKVPCGRMECEYETTDPQS